MAGCVPAADRPRLPTLDLALAFARSQTRVKIRGAGRRDAGEAPLLTTTMALPRSQPGTYVLILRCSTSHMIQIGRLGGLRLEPGFYSYVGSALGSGGIRARVTRHWRGPGQAHWHVDYLRPHTEPLEVWYCHDAQRREHQWANTMASDNGASMPIVGFGSSDCKCKSHLSHMTSCPTLRVFQHRLLSHDPNHPSVTATRY